jgi:hypothetical protein
MYLRGKEMGTAVDYRNVQVSVFSLIAFAAITVNADKTRIYSDQIDDQVIVRNNRILTAGLGMLSSDFVHFIVPSRGTASGTYDGAAMAGHVMKATRGALSNMYSGRNTCPSSRTDLTAT